MEDSEKSWNIIASLVVEFRLAVRLMTPPNDQPSEWSSWLTFPSNGYVELSGIGPVNKTLVIWVEIANAESQKVGRLVPLRKIDHSSEILKTLKAAGVKWESSNGETTRIKIHKNAPKAFET